MRLLRLPGVFAPHPETRLLLSVLARQSLSPPARALDVCTGTGVLALHLARAGVLDVTAVDIARRAVLNARCNARAHGLRVRALRGDLFAPVAGRRFDLVVANPPYVPSAQDTLPTSGPERAWDAGRDGRLLLDRICAQVADHLTPTGRLLVTHSSVAGAQDTLDGLRDAGLAAEVVARRREPLGPVMAARAELFEARGLLAAGDRHEELVVIAASRAATARLAPEPVDGMAAVPVG